jgi:hypothetical protein
MAKQRVGGLANLTESQANTVIPGCAEGAGPESITPDVCVERSPLDSDLARQLPPVVMDSGLIRVPRMPRNDDT